MSSKLSVVIPTRNEEKYLPRCIAALKTSASSLPDLTLEIIVVLNRCSDATESIARQSGCVVVVEDAKNLAKIRNAGIAQATGDFIVTIDADSIAAPTLLPQVVTALQNPSIVGGGILILPERWSLGIACTGLAVGLLLLWYRVSVGVFFARRADFVTLGGFNEALLSIEDIDFARRLRAHGVATHRRFAHLWRTHVVTSCRKFDRFGDWFILTDWRQSLALLKGISQKDADRVWYDFPRE